MRAVRNPGKKAGSPRTSMLGWQALKTKPSKTEVQRALHCPCGREKILALGLLCNLLHLETAGRRIFWWVARAGPRARWLLLPCLRSFGATQTFDRCSSSRTRKSLLHLMISLSPGCHAKVGPTKAALSQMPPLLLELWREQHPLGHEQAVLAFKANLPAATGAPLFLEIVPQA
jgi:hypothetical protein